jgi:hypothetical protein
MRHHRSSRKCENAELKRQDSLFYMSSRSKEPITSEITTPLANQTRGDYLHPTRQIRRGATTVTTNIGPDTPGNS